MILQWNDTMTTGVKEFDDDHKKMIFWVNELIEAISTGKEKREIVDILADLGTLALIHFSGEERCMHKVKCPTAAANKKAHTEFLQYFTKLNNDVRKYGSSAVTVPDLQNSLSTWLENHIITVDTALRTCIILNPKV